MMRLLLCLALFFMTVPGIAREAVPLAPDRAFVLSASLDTPTRLVLSFKIAPGYWLYKDRFQFEPFPGTFQTFEADLPRGILRKDALQGGQRVYKSLVQIPVRFDFLPGRGKNMRFTVQYQGCSARGFCYAPVRKTLAFSPARVTAPAFLDPWIQDGNGETAEAGSYLFSGSGFLLLTGMLGLGLLLAFTPCVLPMVPVLSAIIVGHHRQHGGPKKSFLLSLAYVLGMAFTYALAGVGVALLGHNVQAELQRPWVILLCSGLFVLLGLALLDVYTLQLPRALQQKIGRLTSRLRGGRFASVFLMGSVSTLVVSPCVTAPLIGVLTFIGQTGDIWLGGLALFSMGVGMGIPLLLIGVSAGRFLPRTGPWMNVLERLFGVFMIVLAIWMVSRILPDKHPPVLASAPAQHFFTTVNTGRALDRALQRAHLAGKPVLVDLYADWCTACVLMDRHVFTETKVQAALQSFVRLRVDLTANTAAGRQIMRRFGLAGPPAMLFFDCHGRFLEKATQNGETGRVNVIRQAQRVEAACRK